MAETLTWAGRALDRLRAESGRSGTARREVIEFLDRQDCCLSALEIHETMRSGGSRIGIASVYRTLEGLDRSGLVERVDLGDGVTRFEPARGGEHHHHHFLCGDCGRVEPFADAELESALERLAGGRGFAVEAHDVVLRGACGDCRETVT
jgi:Fur family transcriptional regulator, ferric uptake regulator